MTALRLPPVPGPMRRGVGVALQDADLREVEAELVGHDLRDRRLETLAVARRAGEHVGGAVRPDADRRGVGRHPAERHGRRLGEEADADADEAALGAPRALLLARSSSYPISSRGLLQGLRRRHLVV